MKNGEVLLKELLEELSLSFMTKNRVKELSCTVGCSSNGTEIKDSEVFPTAAGIDSDDRTNHYRVLQRDAHSINSAYQG